MRMLKWFWLDWIFYVVAWTAVTVMYTFFYLSTMRFMFRRLQVTDLIEKDDLTRYMVSDYQYLESVLFGLFFGTAAFAVNRLVDRAGLNRYHFGIILMVKTGLYFLAICLVFIVIAALLIGTGVVPTNYLEILDQGVPLQFILVTLSFFVTSAALINFIALMGRRFGPGNLWGMFLGRYHRPVVENRIFLFLDLRDSTSIAERLGHIRYSRLLQDCFTDLNALLPAAGADIYQYVGDEAVVTWRDEEGGTAAEAIGLFFRFAARLESRSAHYLKTYDAVPAFKAGLHGGPVSTAVVGEYKREIAHHGDVVNTASRLRSACPDLGRNLLISGHMAFRLQPGSPYILEKVGDLQLRGKTAVMPVYAVEITHPHFVS